MAKIQIRRDTSASWAAANPVLASGELTFETDTRVIKIGDGATAYNSLRPAQSGVYPSTKTFFGVSGDNTTALQAFLDGLSAGDDATLYGTINFTTVTVNVAKVRLHIAPNAVLNKTTSFTDGIIVNAADVTIEGPGTIQCPAAWDGTNTTWTYAVIRVVETTGPRCTIDRVKLVNVPKIGIGIRARDCEVVNCRIYGNYPANQWSGVETGHAGVTWDPPAGGDGGAGRTVGNLVQTCVQGVSLGNYGAGVGEGYLVDSNTFWGCLNHGIYQESGTATTINGNSFYQCYQPIVITGTGHSITGNTLYTDTTGTNQDNTGISIRDPQDCVITGNTVIGDATSVSIGIGLDSILGNTIARNIIANNVIDLGGSGGQPAIRVGTSLTTICLNNAVRGNIIKSPGKPSNGMINTAMAPSSYAYGNKFNDNHITITGGSAAPSHGIALVQQRGAQAIGNTIRNEWIGSSAGTSAFVTLQTSRACTIKDNVSINPNGFGANLNIRAIQADAASDSNLLAVGKAYLESGYNGFTECLDQGTSNLTELHVGNYIAATALGTLSGKMAVTDSQTGIKGYVPIYTTIT